MEGRTPELSQHHSGLTVVPMMMYEKILRRLRDLGMNQGELERLTGLAVNRISKWKGGSGEPTARQALAIARVLKVPLEWLCDEEVTGDPPGAARAGEILTDMDRVVLGVARKVGHEELLSRLIERPTAAAHVPVIPPQSLPRGTPSRPVEPPPARKRRKGSA